MANCQQIWLVGCVWAELNLKFWLAHMVVIDVPYNQSKFGIPENELYDY